MKISNALIFLILIFLSKPFIHAIEKERLLLFFNEYDASAEKRDWQWARLPYAIEKGYVDIAEFLILRGDLINNYREWRKNQSLNNDIDYYIKHPLLTSIRKNYVDLSILIIQTSKDPSKAEEYKDLAYKASGQSAHQRFIVERKTAMHVAIAESQNSNNVVLALLIAGVNVNQAYKYQIPSPPYNFYNSTPLKTAISLRKLDIMKLLLEYNADVEYRGEQNDTPLIMAVEDNYIEGVRLLLEYGADPLSASLITPFELAMQKGYWDIVDLLLDAAVNEKN